MAQAQARTRSSNGSKAAASKPRRSTNGGAPRKSTASKTAKAKTSQAKASKSSTSQAKASKAKTSKPSTSQAKSRSRKPAEAGIVDRLKAPAAKASGPVLAGVATAAGVVGGAVLGSRFARRPKRVLGVPIPGTGRGLDGLAKQVGKAGKQFADLASEVHEARKKAQEVSKALS